MEPHQEERQGLHQGVTGLTDTPERYALAAFFGAGGRELVEHIPHCRRLGMEVVDVGPHRATVRLPYREELVGDPVRRVIFGGVITTLIDHAAGLAVFASLPDLRTIATLDLRIDYLRAAEPERALVGAAHCYKLTTHVAFVRATAWEHHPEDPFASCLATFMIGANPNESAVARAARARGQGG